MLPTHAKFDELLIKVYTPLISGGRLLRDLNDAIDSYSHIIAADGGYISAEISIKANLDIADEWLTEGIGRHIEVYGPHGEPVWEGFVNNIAINFGNYTMERGRLTDVCNRCSVLYTPIIDYDPETGQPIGGTPTTTVIAEDVDSQEKYGIWEQVVSVGLILDDDAEYLRDVYLNEHKDIATVHSPTIYAEAGSDVVITVSLRGYIDWIGAYIYENTGTPTSTTADDKITTVLASEPNSIISSDTTQIIYNGVLVPTYEDESRNGLAIIEETVSIGDIYGNRWIFGLYEDRIAKYNEIPDEVEYYHYIGQEGQRITNTTNGKIELYNVRPGKFAMIKDVAIGKLVYYSELRVDERIMFIEQVTFTAPATIVLQGSKVGTFAQILARLGLAGG